MFSSLSIRDFRIYWIGMLISMCGTWIQSMAQNWLVFELSHSSFILGLVGFVSFSPVLLFSLFFGVLVDRLNKRVLLLIAQISFMCLAFLLAFLTQYHLVTVNMIMLISVLSGIIMSLDGPARQAMIFELVGKNRILNAIALNSIAFHSARMLGPALAGILVTVIGIAGCFYLNAVSFLAFIVALFLIAHHPAQKNSNGNHFFEDLKEGVRFIKKNRIFLILIVVSGLVSLFGFSYVILLPVVAKTMLHLDVRGYGFLMSASGIGSLLGGLVLANLKKPRLQPAILIFSLCAFSLSLVLFSFAKTFASSLIILVGAGFFSLLALAIINTIIQEKVPDAFRGRVLSIYLITFSGTIPFGSLLAGLLAQSFGVQTTLFWLGLVCFILFVLMSKKLLRRVLLKGL